MRSSRSSGCCQRAYLGRRHADRSLGVDEELPIKDGSGEPPGPGRNGERDFRKEKRSNGTHASTTDPDARLDRKADGQESRLCFMGHALMENRNGLVDTCLTHATGTAERDAALLMLDWREYRHRIRLGADGAVSKTGKVRERAVLVSCETDVGDARLVVGRPPRVDGQLERARYQPCRSAAAAPHA